MSRDFRRKAATGLEAAGKVPGKGFNMTLRLGEPWVGPEVDILFWSRGQVEVMENPGDDRLFVVGTGSES